MAALTKAQPRTFGVDVPPQWNELVVTSGTQVWAGGAVEVVIATGLVRPLTGDTTVAHFAGFADESVLGDGTKRVRIRTIGSITLAVTGVDSNNDAAKAVYMANDNDASLTQGTNDPQIGVVKRHESGTTCVVDFKAATVA